MRCQPPVVQHLPPAATRNIHTALTSTSTPISKMHACCASRMQVLASVLAAQPIRYKQLKYRSK